MHGLILKALENYSCRYVHKLNGKGIFNLLLMMKGGFLKLNYCWMGKESWNAIKKLFNLPFLTLKFRYPAIS